LPHPHVFQRRTNQAPANALSLAVSFHEKHGNVFAISKVKHTHEPTVSLSGECQVTSTMALSQSLRRSETVKLFLPFDQILSGDKLVENPPRQGRGVLNLGITKPAILDNGAHGVARGGTTEYSEYTETGILRSRD